MALLEFYMMALLFLFYPSWSQKLAINIIKGTPNFLKKKKKRVLSLIHDLPSIPTPSVLIATMPPMSICMRLKLSPVIKRVEYLLLMQNTNLLSTVNRMPSIHTEYITISNLGVFCLRM